MGEESIVEVLRSNLSEEYVEDAKRRLTESVSKIQGFLDERDKVREEAIRLSREIIRSSGWAITEIHKGNVDKALEYLGECEEKTRKLLNMLSSYPDLLYSGMVYNCVSEYVEARLFIDLITGNRLRGPEELGVPPVPYLQGLGDLVGEIKRVALELVRLEEYGIAWRLLQIAEHIYLLLRGLDYPDAIAPGIRRKADIARRVVDDLKAMLVDLDSRSRLSKLLEENIRLKTH